jgi:hypothetical protein
MKSQRAIKARVDLLFLIHCVFAAVAGENDGPLHLLSVKCGASCRAELLSPRVVLREARMDLLLAVAVLPFSRNARSETETNRFAV